MWPSDESGQNNHRSSWPFSHRLFCLALVIVLLSSGHQVQAKKNKHKKNSGPSAKIVLQNLELYDAATNALLAVVDKRLQPREVCGIDAHSAYPLMSVLHAKTDVELRTYLKAKTEGKQRLSETSWSANCEKTCRCGLFTSILATGGLEKILEADRAVFKKTSLLAMNQTKQTLTECARTQHWFCSSPLLTELKKEVVKPTPRGLNFHGTDEQSSQQPPELQSE